MRSPSRRPDARRILTPGIATNGWWRSEPADTILCVAPAASTRSGDDARLAIAAPNRASVDAGLRVAAEGGNAVDAAVAALVVAW